MQIEARDLARKVALKTEGRGAGFYTVPSEKPIASAPFFFSAENQRKWFGVGRIERGKEATPLHSHTQLSLTLTHCQGVTQVRTEQAESSLSEERAKGRGNGKMRIFMEGAEAS